MEFSRFKATISLIIANIIWGGAGPIFKWSMNNINPFTLAFFRFSFGTLLLLPFVWKMFKKIEKTDFLKIVLFGLCGVTFNITFFFLGLRLAPAINAAIIATSQPFLLLLIGYFFLKENVQRIEILGTIVSFSGVLLIIFYPLFENGFPAQSTFLGNFFFTLATFGAVGQAYFGKQLFKKYYPLPITCLSFLIGTITFFPFFLFEAFKDPLWLVNLKLPGLIGIIYGSIFSSALAYSLYDLGLAKIEASETGIFTYLMPIVSVLISVLLFKEKINTPFIIGSSLVILGIILTEHRLPYHPLHKKINN